MKKNKNGKDMIVARYPEGYYKNKSATAPDTGEVVAP
jgi:hypothetical protein